MKLFRKISYFGKKLIISPVSFMKDVWYYFMINKNYFYLHGKAPLPRTIAFHITDKCNARCTICWMYGPQGRFISSCKPRIEISDHLIKKVIDEVSFFKPNLYFTGGEPLLSSSLFFAIRYASSRKLNCEINTNGILLEKFADELLDAGLSVVTVSLFGPEKVHDSIVGVNGAFEKMMKGISAISKAKNSKKCLNPIIRVNCPITGENYRDLSEVIEIAEKLKIDKVTFSHLRYTPDVVNCRHKRFFQDRLGIESNYFDGDIKDTNGIVLPVILTQFQRLKSKLSSHIFVDFYPKIKYSQLVSYYFDPKYSFKGKGCTYPWTIARIMPDGSLVGCLIDDWIIGNIQKNNFLSLWNHKRFQKFRKTLRSVELFPGCFRCCQSKYK